jgi:hypothetical protein
MVDAAGALKPVSIGTGIDRCEDGGKGKMAGASLSDTVGDSGGTCSVASSEEGEDGMTSGSGDASGA